MPNPPPPLLRADAVYFRDATHLELRDVSLAIGARRFTLLSGSGGGQLLRILGLLERPEAGEVWFEGQPTAALDEAARLELRNHAFGYLFAEPFLLDSFSVAENVAMPLFKIAGMDIGQARTRTAQVLDFAGLAGGADACVSGLSLLDHHKVALARALAVAPRILVAEGAGALLPAREFREFATLLRAVPEALGVAVLATSSAGPAVFGPDREIRIEEGCIAADSRPVEEAPAHE